MKNEENDLIEKENANLFGDKKDEFTVTELSVEKYEHFEAFYPHPDIFEGLSKVDQSFPREVMDMAKANSEAEIRKVDAEIRKTDAEIRKMDEENKLDHRNVTQEGIGQVFIFILTLILIGVSVFLALEGHELLAIAPFLGGMIPIITAAIQSLKKK
jgi:hypothetical protein